MHDDHTRMRAEIRGTRRRLIRTWSMSNDRRLRHLLPPLHKLILHRHARAQAHAPIALLRTPARLPAALEVVYESVPSSAPRRRPASRGPGHLALAPFPIANNHVLELIAPLLGPPSVRVQPGVFSPEA